MRTTLSVAAFAAVMMGSLFPIGAAEKVIRVTPKTERFEVLPNTVLEFRAEKLVIRMENSNTRLLKGETLKEADGKAHPPQYGVVRTARYRVVNGSAATAAEVVLTGSNAPTLRGKFEKVVSIVDSHFFDTWALADAQPLPQELYVRHVQWIAVGTAVVATFEIFATPTEVRVYYDPNPAPPADFRMLASAPTPPAPRQVEEVLPYKGEQATTLVALANDE